MSMHWSLGVLMAGSAMAAGASMSAGNMPKGRQSLAEALTWLTPRRKRGHSRMSPFTSGESQESLARWLDGRQAHS
jgi:hypothetical protein